ncbi:DDE_3 domain-containing protein [Trichonephila clavipes]|nr:DDE_3 domain-containing protein [Trichonephila clavipes]
MWAYPAGTWNRPECHLKALTTIPLLRQKTLHPLIHSQRFQDDGSMNSRRYSTGHPLVTPNEDWSPGFVCGLIIAGLSYGERQLPFTTKRTSLNYTVSVVQDGSCGSRDYSGFPRTDLQVQVGVTIDQIYRDVILENHVRLFWVSMGAEFVFMDDNARPHHVNIVNECLQSEDITRMDWAAFYRT